ncbi:MAG: Ltp family lipoprotein [Rhodospirillales bacterium]|nr:Ltp family lipoprotein [Rhodospirillales bacterium]
MKKAVLVVTISLLIGFSAASAQSLTGPQQNAVRSAHSYISVMGFSRSGLIDQLSFEGYARHDAAVAVDSMSVDWNEQAVKSANNYLSVMGFSCRGLIDQLAFDGYTRSQAEHGAHKTGAC